MEVRMQNAGKGDQMEVKKPLSSGSEPLHGKCSPLRSSHRDMIRDLEHRRYRIYLVRNIGHLRLKSMRISSCFFSTRENMRISPISVRRKRFKYGVTERSFSPVMSRFFLSKGSPYVFLLLFFRCFCKICNSEIPGQFFQCGFVIPFIYVQKELGIYIVCFFYRFFQKI